MVDNNKKWLWDDDEDEIDLAELNAQRESKSTEDDSPEDNKTQEELDRERAHRRAFDDWHYETHKDIIDTHIKDNQNLHNEIIAERELTEEEKDKVQTNFEKKVNRLKLKNVSNEATSEVIISSNGMTLSEYLDKAHLRKNKGRRRTNEERRRGDRLLALSERAKKPLYGKSAIRQIELEEKKKIQKNKRDNKVRKEVQRDKYKRLAPNEQELLKSLGMTEDELINKIGVNSLLTEKEKAKILSEGYFGISKTTNVGVKRSYTTLGDIQILSFLYRFQIASINILSIALNKTKRAITGQLGKLYNLGLVDKMPVEGNIYIWGITKLGQSLITDDTRPPKRPKVKGVSQLLTINYVVACLYSNTINALNLDDFPYSGREFQGEILQGEEIIPERFLRSSLYKMSTEMGFGRSINSAINNRVLEQAEAIWREWEIKGRSQDSPELIPDNEYLYLLYPKGSFTDSYVIPDLIVKRPRSSDGTPNNIAIEVERQIKTVSDYKKKLLAYKQDTRLYSKVVYITSSKKVVERVLQAAEEIKFDRFDIVPFLDREGSKMSIRDPWTL